MKVKRCLICGGTGEIMCSHPSHFIDYPRCTICTDGFVVCTNCNGMGYNKISLSEKLNKIDEVINI